MIKMAKMEGSRNAPFLYVRRRCLSNPFTPPVYIEGRNGRCRWNQRNRADIPDVRSWQTVCTVRSMKHCTVVTGRAAVSVVTIGGGRRQGRGTWKHILCACSAWRKVGQWPQPLSTMWSRTVVIPFCSGTRRTGRAYANLVMIKRHGTRITILSIGSDGRPWGYQNLYGVSCWRPMAPFAWIFAELNRGDIKQTG